MITFACPNCEALYSTIDDDLIGTQTRCIECGAVIVVREVKPSMPSHKKKEAIREKVAAVVDRDISFKCGGCGFLHQLSADSLGTKVKCISCREVIRLPKLADPSGKVLVAEIEPSVIEAAEPSFAERLAIEALSRPRSDDLSKHKIHQNAKELKLIVDHLEEELRALPVSAASFQRDDTLAKLVSKLQRKREELLAVPDSPSITLSFEKSPTAAPTVTVEAVPEEVVETIEDMEEEKTKAPAKPKKSRNSKKKFRDADEDNGHSTSPDFKKKEVPQKAISPKKVAAFIVLPLLIIGAGWYGLDSMGNSKTPTKQAAKRTIPVPVLPSKEAAPTPEVPIKKEIAKELPKKEEPAGPPLSDRAEEAITIGAASLQREFTANPKATDEKYKGKLLLVRGLTDRFDGKLTPAQIFFAGTQVHGDVRSSDKIWSEYKPKQPLQIIGFYRKDCTLEKCEPFVPPCTGDILYKRKKIELFGTVLKVDPLTFVNPDMDNFVAIEYVFKASDKPTLIGIEPGMVIALEGVCNGRSETFPKPVVRLDNCRRVPNRAFDREIERVPYDQFMRDYEEDIREEERVDISDPASMFTADNLVKEYEGKPAATEHRFYRKVLIVAGTVLENKDGKIVFEGSTEDKFQVRGSMTTALAKKLGSAKRLSLRGVFCGIKEKKLIQLENCEVADIDGLTAGGSERWLTADYFPHRPGQVLIYDDLRITTVANNQVLQHSLAAKRDGSFEFRPIQSGVLPAASFSSGKNAKWTKQISTPTVLTLHYEINDGFVQLGQWLKKPTFADPNSFAVLWEPVLALGAIKGEGWQSTSPVGAATYRVVSFGMETGKPSVVIRKNWHPAGSLFPLESLQTFVRGIGEIERTTFELNPNANKKVISESRLVDEAAELKEEAKMPPDSEIKLETPDKKKDKNDVPPKKDQK